MKSTSIQSKIVFRQDTAPPDQSALWLDTNFDPAILKTYNNSQNSWQKVASSVVSKQDTPPTNPVDGDMWQDTSESPPILKTYNNNTGNWEQISANDDSLTAKRERLEDESNYTATSVTQDNGDTTGPACSTSNYPATYTQRKFAETVSVTYTNGNGSRDADMDFTVNFSDGTQVTDSVTGLSPGNSYSFNTNHNGIKRLDNVIIDGNNRGGLDVVIDRPEREVLVIPV